MRPSIQWSDEKLITTFLSGNSNSFNLLLKKHQQKVFAFILSKVKNRDIANDIFQDVFVKIIQTLRKGKYSEDGKFQAWMMRLTYHMIIDHFRKEKKKQQHILREHSIPVEGVAPDQSELDEVLQKDELLSSMESCIPLLPDGQREIVEDRILRRMSFKEIAEQRDISINTALGRMRYAVINLRKMMVELMPV